MARRRRAWLGPEADRRNRVQLGALGGKLREARRRRRISQLALARRAGIGQNTVSRMELGRGGTMTLDSWQRLAVALGLDLRVELGRDPVEETADAGHLAIQELILRLARTAGRASTFELPTRPADPGRSVDVGLRDDRHRRLMLVEAWNSFGDIGSAARSTDRKLAEAAAFAIAIGGEEPYAVRGCWVVRATARNRALIARYPQVFTTRFPGSSLGWVRAIAGDQQPPAEQGLVWCDVRATRLFPWRRR